MISKDFDLVNKIYNCINNSLEDDYDSFTFTVYVHDLYQESDILVTKDGVSTDSPRIKANAESEYEYVKELKKNSAARGENWNSFTLSYTKGAQVSVKYNYSKNQ